MAYGVDSEGYDNDEIKHNMEWSYGYIRKPRYKDITSHINFYNKTDGRRIFICFHDAGYNVVNSLLFSFESIKNINDLKNIVVVMIPDVDWISNYKIPANLLEYTIKNIGKKFETTQSYFDYDWLENFDEKVHGDNIGRFIEQCNNDVYEIQSLASKLIFRLAFKKYMNLFQAVK